ncbi:unnamed protein product [Penicillium camemberti]|uniref:Str. FM013 n=1 Tax=Penicillium camemberti (strain FM 013) TaxID=1429867 RepID=A0A0G4PVT0_PENC3|nr:unnamed protein product [Penicillium camemberti]
MEPSNASDYVADLERQIYGLRQILREWTPYVPPHVLVRSQIPREITSSHLLRPPVSQPLSATKHKGVSLSGLSRLEETWKKPLENFINRIPCAEKWSGAVSLPQISILDLLF